MPETPAITESHPLDGCVCFRIGRCRRDLPIPIIPQVECSETPIKSGLLSYGLTYPIGVSRMGVLPITPPIRIAYTVESFKTNLTIV